MEKPLNVHHWGKKPKGSQTAASFKVLAVEHPRKKQTTLSHKPLQKKKNTKKPPVNHSAKNNGGNPVGK